MHPTAQPSQLLRCGPHRHSGSDTFSATSLTPGSSLGRNTAASAGFSTSLLMLSMMTQDLRLMAVVLSRRPRTSRGTMIARAGASTACSKTVSGQWVKHRHSRGTGPPLPAGVEEGDQRWIMRKADNSSLHNLTLQSVACLAATEQQQMARS